MQSDLPRSSRNREATNRALARHTAFASLFCAVVAIMVAVALDLTFLVPLIFGKPVYNPIRDFLSYQVDEKSGPLMMGVFLLLAVSAWSYAVAALLAPSRHVTKINFAGVFIFGCGLFVGACFRAVPSTEQAVDHWLKNEAFLHDVGIGAGFVPAMIAAFADQWKIVFHEKGFLLSKISFWLIVVGTVGMIVALLFLHNFAGLFQRFYVIGIVLWLATEAHQLFWSSSESDPAPKSSDDALVANSKS